MHCVVIVWCILPVLERACVIICAYVCVCECVCCPSRSLKVANRTVCSSLWDEPSSGLISAAHVRVYIINSLNALMRALMHIMQSSRLAAPRATC